MQNPPSHPLPGRLLALAVLAGHLLLLPSQSADASSVQLEKAYQQSLKDPEFKDADSVLRATYGDLMRLLPVRERASLRDAERLWIKENATILASDPQGEARILKERFLKRRDELLQLKKEGRPVTPQPKPVPSSSPVPVPSPVADAPDGAAKAVKSQTPAENLERAYQKALKDSEFENADATLRSVFNQALGVLNAEDRLKLRSAEKAWVKENGELIRSSQGTELELMKERTMRRTEQLSQMLRGRRFIASPAASAAPSLPAPAPATILRAVREEPVPDPAPPAEAPVADESAEVFATPRAQIGAGWVFLLWCAGFVLSHYWAFKSVGKASANRFLRLPNSKKLYLGASAGFLFSLLCTGAEGGSAWILSCGVLFTLLGLLFLWAAAVDAAGLAYDAASHSFEIPNGFLRVKVPIKDIRRIEDSAFRGKGGNGVHLYTVEDTWALSFESKEKQVAAYLMLQELGGFTDRKKPSATPRGDRKRARR